MNKSRGVLPNGRYGFWLVANPNTDWSPAVIERWSRVPGRIVGELGRHPTHGRLGLLWGRYGYFIQASNTGAKVAVPEGWSVIDYKGAERLLLVRGFIRPPIS